MEKIVLNAALPDNRPHAQQERDYTTEEIPAAAVPAFGNSKPTSLAVTIYDQWYVGSCVPHGFLTQLEYEGIVPESGMSQLRAYRKRINYPGAGSVAVDMYNQIRSGLNEQDDFPTPPGFTEPQASAMAYVMGEKLIPDFNYFQYKNSTGILTPELIPSDVASGKAVSIFFYATEREWSQEYVEIKDPDLKITQAAVRHCVCIVPKGDFTENGKQWLAVHDSAKFGGRHLRYIDLDFLLARYYFAAKVYKKEEKLPAPIVLKDPVVSCSFGQKNNGVLDIFVTPKSDGTNSAVLVLQKFLVKEGKLEARYTTGYYGALTAKAVLWWQLENWDKFTSSIPELLNYGGKYWGSQSIAAL